MSLIVRLAAPFALTLVAACAIVPRADDVAQAEEQAVTPAPLSVPGPSANSATEPTPAGPVTFVFSGELTQGGWIRGQVPAGTRSAKLGEEPLVIDEDGRFFAAFDRDASPDAELTATLVDGRTIRVPVSVSPRAWNLEHINAPLRPGGGSSEAFMRRRRPELDAIWAAREQATDAQGWRQDFIWPVEGRISGRFGSQRIYQGEPGSYHSGLDIAPGAGTPFVAPADGVVVLAARDAPFSLEGHLLIIDHGQGLNSAFLHAQRLDVVEGDRVTQGQQLGLVGATGRVTGPHLHWSIKWHNGARLDPLLFVDPQS